MIKSCVICGKKFEYKRDSALYCSHACKQKKARIKKRVDESVKKRVPSLKEFNDMQLVKAISDDTYKLMSIFWGKYGKTIAMEVLEIVWSLMVDANLVPDNYGDDK